MIYTWDLHSFRELPSCPSRITICAGAEDFFKDVPRFLLSSDTGKCPIYSESQTMSRSALPFPELILRELGHQNTAPVDMDELVVVAYDRR